MTQFDPNIFQAAMLKVAEATEAGVAVAKSAAVPPQQVQAAPSGSKPVVDWSKLVNKPAVFDHKFMDGDLKNLLWQLTQYMVTVDEGYETELRSLTDDPGNPLEMSTASAETRQRSAKLYGVLASLVRNRALIVQSCSAGDHDTSWMSKCHKEDSSSLSKLKAECKSMALGSSAPLPCKE